MTKEPRCPKCGEPPRVVIAVRKTRCAYLPGGKVGPVQWAGPVHRTETLQYQCGGGHTWDSEAT